MTRRTDQSMGAVLDFMRALWAVDHGLRSKSKIMRKELGVTGPQRLVLRMLSEFSDLTPGHLSELLHLHPSTLTGILKRLEERGLIARHNDPTDGRQAVVSLTSRGARLAPACVGTVEESVRRTLKRLPAAKVQVARDVLDALALELGDEPHLKKEKST